MKSMCQDARRNSPSVADWRPTSSCIRTTSRIDSSSICFSSSAEIAVGREVLAGLQQALGPQQAADVVGTERRCRARHDPPRGLLGLSAQYAASRLIVKQFDPSDRAVSSRRAGLGALRRSEEQRHPGGGINARVWPVAHCRAGGAGGCLALVRRRLWRRRQRQRRQWRQRHRRSRQAKVTALQVRPRQRQEGHRRRRSSSARIATKQPGTDFSEIARTAEAYFNCVNDNGGINGRPVDYVVETEQTDPGQVGLAGEEADRDREGARHRRQHRASSSAPSTTSTTRRRAST